jgi:hypothetical protein
MEVQLWAIEKLIFYARNPRKNEEVPVILSNTCSAAHAKAFRDLSSGRGRIGTYALVGEVCDAAA